MSILFLSVILGGKLFANVNAKDDFVKSYAQIMVEDGDSLWSIANRYTPEGYDVKDYMDELKQLNHIENDVILAGYTLTVVLYN